MIEIVASTPLVTIQDAGRFGLRRFGIGTAGAMDGLALRAANEMLGNDPQAAALEVTGSPLRLRFHQDTALALTGADGEARLDNVPLPPWWTTRVRAGTELALRPPRKGLRCYLAFSGGIEVAPVLGSRSTDVKAGYGGLEGRALVRGDWLKLGTSADGAPGAFGVMPPLAVLKQPMATAGDAVALRVLPAAQYGRFTERSREIFWSSPWTVGQDSNRMGLRLSGEVPMVSETFELLSHGILPGVIQVPPSGQPIIQASDANTCGGYPKMGVVIGADLWRMGQVRPGDTLRFVQTEWRDAIAALDEQKAYLARIARAAALARRLGSAAASPATSLRRAS